MDAKAEEEEMESEREREEELLKERYPPRPCPISPTFLLHFDSFTCLSVLSLLPDLKKVSWFLCSPQGARHRGVLLLLGVIIFCWCYLLSTQLVLNKCLPRSQVYNFLPNHGL